MALSDQSTLTPPKGEAAVKKFASRDDWLAAVGKLKEEETEIEGIGLLLLSEVTGEVRAELMSDASAVLLAAEGATKKIDRRSYEKKLLLAGVVDPESTAADRAPLFKAGDMDKIMKLGGGKIAAAVDVIERLSGLGQYTARAEGNSAETQNGVGTS